MIKVNYYKINYFNSHAHVERDKGVPETIYSKINFNSHAHVERDVFDGKEWNTEKNFNSHAHVERDVFYDGTSKDFVNFNSHAHVERDSETIDNISNIMISTHTLTWSVTLDVVYIWCLLNVMRTYFFI